MSCNSGREVTGRGSLERGLHYQRHCVEKGICIPPTLTAAIISKFSQSEKSDWSKTCKLRSICIPSNLTAII